ncbi:MAG: 2-polyprenyl-6-methoxyphenol 4-hydroxylase [Cellvibrionaceae bacterium]|jgi:2-polyprenyl-6-methoxyphenol 4-hydroxylase
MSMNVSQKNKAERKGVNTEIVIVGGGMVGISLALLLEHSSIPCSVTLIEQTSLPESDAPLQSQTSFDERSTALSATSAALFEHLGIWEKLSHRATAINTVHVSDKDHFGGLTLTAEEFHLPALGYVLPNRWMGQVLAQSLRNLPIKVVTPAKTLSANAVSGGYEIVIETGGARQTLTPDLLIIADGADSPLRTILGIDTKIHDYGQSALVANVSLDRPHQGVAYERFTSEGPLALLPLPDWQGQHRGTVVWTLKDPDAARSLTRGELTQALQQTFGYRAGIISAMGEYSIYPLRLVEANEQVRSHLVVMGNAAHFIHPVAGQGFNLALRGCQCLATVLQAPNGTEAFGSFTQLNTYLNRQIHDQRLTIDLTNHLVKLFSTRSAFHSMVRQLGLIGMNFLSPIKGQFGQIMIGVR